VTLRWPRSRFQIGCGAVLLVILALTVAATVLAQIPRSNHRTNRL